jgi:Domain of unknown function (DUF4349)
MRNNRFFTPVLLLIVLLSSGCARAVSTSSPVLLKAQSEVSVDQNSSSEFRPDRMLIWRANLEIEVSEVNDAIGKAIAIAEKSGGYLEWKSENGQQSAQARLRIPIKDFKNALGAFEALGTVISRSINGEDVTEKYIDLDARLKNKYALRDRLKQLLEKAVNIKDLLAIETELNRVQSDIDSMEGTMKSLKGQVDLATVDLSFKRRQILGPLGYVVTGLWWVVKKLFVLSD